MQSNSILVAKFTGDLGQGPSFPEWQMHLIAQCREKGFADALKPLQTGHGLSSAQLLSHYQNDSSLYQLCLSSLSSSALIFIMQSCPLTEDTPHDIAVGCNTYLALKAKYGNSTTVSKSVSLASARVSMVGGAELHPDTAIQQFHEESFGLDSNTDAIFVTPTNTPLRSSPTSSTSLFDFHLSSSPPLAVQPHDDNHEGMLLGGPPPALKQSNSSTSAESVPNEVLTEEVNIAVTHPWELPRRSVAVSLQYFLLLALKEVHNGLPLADAVVIVRNGISSDPPFLLVGNLLLLRCILVEKPLLLCNLDESHSRLLVRITAAGGFNEVRLNALELFLV